MTVTSATDTDTRRSPRRRAIAITAAALTAIVAVLLTPLPRGFQGDVTGDEALMEATAGARWGRALSICKHHPWARSLREREQQEKRRWCTRRSRRISAVYCQSGGGSVTEHEYSG